MEKILNTDVGNSIFCSSIPKQLIVYHAPWSLLISLLSKITFKHSRNELYLSLNNLDTYMYIFNPDIKE